MESPARTTTLPIAPKRGSSDLDLGRQALQDIVENRCVGLKSRGCYDSPAMTTPRLVQISIEGLAVDDRVISLRNVMSQHWSELFYQSADFSTERASLQREF
ncbi:Argininosuccinate synthase [Colletotrichum tropicale]|nr:Argininosuccinate synthase [Colletotrichum tropicale]